MKKEKAPVKVAKKKTVASKKKVAKPKAPKKKVKMRNTTGKVRTLTDKKKAMLKIISKTKGLFTLQVAGEAIGYKGNPFASMYAYSVIKALINKGLVKKNQVSERKATYSVV